MKVDKQSSVRERVALDLLVKELLVYRSRKNAVKKEAAAQAPEGRAGAVKKAQPESSD